MRVLARGLLIVAMVAAPTWVATSATAGLRHAADLPTTIEALAGPVDLTPPVALSAPAGSTIEHASRSSLRDSQAAPTPAATSSSETVAAAECSGVVSGAMSNGRLTAANLCDLWQKPYKDRADAVVTAFAMNDAFVAKFGRPMCLTSGYRTYEEQARLRAAEPGIAAAAGTSNHGWGLAIDFCPNTYGGAAGAWLRANGPKFGWDNPSWARPGGSGAFEPWHWEFVAGVKALGK